MGHSFRFGFKISELTPVVNGTYNANKEGIKMNYGCHSMIGKIDTVLLKKPENAFIDQEHLDTHWQAFAYFGPPDYGKTLEEYDAFERIIQDHVPNVHYLPKEESVGLDSIYTHDPLKVTRRGAIYFPMGKELRNGEGTATRRYLESLDIPTLGVIRSPGKMEGGDVVWLDDETVAIGRGYRTNDEGIRQFRELTQDFIKEYVIVPMPHAGGPEACLHLMSIISLIDSDKACVYSEYMPVFFREYLIDKGFQLIECGKEEYELLGSNVLCLAPGVCLMIEGCPKIKADMEQAGVTVYTYPGQELSYKGTGGPTCLTCPILRL